MTASNSLLARGLRFLGRVQFTTLLLVAGVIIMTAGTIVESRQGREFAWFAIYGTLWFDAFLLLIGVNLVVAVVNRIPIQRHQWPFVVTHFAIVLLLAGAWISRSFGYEGRLVIYEGSTESQLVLDTSEVRARWVAPGDSEPGPEQVFPLPAYRRLDCRVLAPEGPGRPGLRIAEYEPVGVSSLEPRHGIPGGVPGVVLTLSSGEEQVERWLLADHPEHGRRDVGPAEIEMRRVGAGVAAAGPGEGSAVLVAPGGGLPLLRIPVPAALGSEQPLGDGRVPWSRPSRAAPTRPPWWSCAAAAAARCTRCSRASPNSAPCSAPREWARSRRACAWTFPGTRASPGWRCCSSPTEVCSCR
jgi:hypothetical protein